MTVVSMEDVVLALKNTLGKKGMSDDDIQKLAEYLMSFFGFEGEVIDNRLTSEDRDVFYMLEEEGFLTTTQEEVHLKKGKLWRIHYWILKKDQIIRLAHLAKKGVAATEEETALYEQMDEDIWKSHHKKEGID